MCFDEDRFYDERMHYLYDTEVPDNRYKFKFVLTGEIWIEAESEDAAEQKLIDMSDAELNRHINTLEDYELIEKEE